MNEPYKNSKTVTTHQLFWRSHIYYCCTAVLAQKIIMFNAFSWAKNTAHGVRFVLGFNMYLILAQCEQVRLFLALAQLQITNCEIFYVPFAPCFLRFFFSPSLSWYISFLRVVRSSVQESSVTDLQQVVRGLSSRCVICILPHLGVPLFLFA